MLVHIILLLFIVNVLFVIYPSGGYSAGEHSVNSMCYDTIKLKPVVCTDVYEQHMNSCLTDLMISSLS